jgi:hypothetical protein
MLFFYLISTHENYIIRKKIKGPGGNHGHRGYY